MDGARPSVAWVAGLPSEWTTPHQRLVLLILACDAFGDVSRPGIDALMAWSGLLHGSVYRVLNQLATPVGGLRPALIERVDHLGRPVTIEGRRGRHRAGFRLLIDSQPSGGRGRLNRPRDLDGLEVQPSNQPSNEPSTSAGPSLSLPLPNSSPKVTRDRVGDDDGLRPIRELTPWRELAKAGGER